MRAELELAAVTVSMALVGSVLTGVRRIAHARGGGRAGDVGDRRDVVPVDPVPDPEEQAGQEDTDIGDRLSGRGGDAEQIDHGRTSGARSMLPDTTRYRNTLQLMSMASRSILRSMTATGSRRAARADSTPAGAAAGPAWTDVRDQLRARGLRWTPQRRTLIEVLSKTDGHVTGAELVDRCRAIDRETIPSTVYRTL